MPRDVKVAAPYMHGPYILYRMGLNMKRFLTTAKSRPRRRRPVEAVEIEKTLFNG
jgi:hypothetical protein